MDYQIGNWLRGAAFVAAFVLCLPGAVIAQSASQNVCVTCEGPATVYSCSLAPEVARRSGRGLSVMCIQEIARRYKHASCAVRRNQVGACNGQVYMLSSRQAEPSKSNDVVTTTTPYIKSKQVAPKTREPKTVVELAKRTAKTTNKEIKRSAEKVSRAARSTWRCISTLFSKC
jgi:hypothetical protein